MNLSRLAAALCGLAILAAPAFAAEPFVLNDGDRVVLVGGTLIEREQRVRLLGGGVDQSQSR